MKRKSPEYLNAWYGVRLYIDDLRQVRDDLLAEGFSVAIETDGHEEMSLEEVAKSDVSERQHLMLSANSPRTRLLNMQCTDGRIILSGSGEIGHRECLRIEKLLNRRNRLYRSFARNFMGAGVLIGTACILASWLFAPMSFRGAQATAVFMICYLLIQSAVWLWQQNNVCCINHLANANDDSLLGGNGTKSKIVLLVVGGVIALGFDRLKDRLRESAMPSGSPAATKPAPPP